MNSSHLIRTNGSTELEVSYECGSGEALTFLHPIGLSAGWWDPYLHRYRGDYSVVAISFPGHGRSTRPDGAISLGSLTEHVLAAWDFLEVERSVVIGASLGGMVAQELARRIPTRVSGLVLVSTTDRLDERSRSTMLARAAACREKGMRGVIAETLARWISPAEIAEKGQFYQRMATHLAGIDPNSHAMFWEAIADLKTDWTPAHTGPDALVVVGENDQSTPVSAARRIADLREAPLVVVPGGAHMVAFEEPRSVITALDRFISKCA